MKKNQLYGILGLLLGLMCTFSLASCGDDDDNDNNATPSNSIVGTWAFTEEYSEGEWYMKHSIIYQFKNDGTFTQSMVHTQGEVGKQAQNNEEGEQLYGTYKVDGNKLTLINKGLRYKNYETGNWEDSPNEQPWETTYKFEVSGNTLKLYWMEQNGQTSEEPQVFTKA